MAIKPLAPFRLWVLQNFPFIAQDFDALTNYELMCKIVEYLNNVINVTNEQTKAINDLYTWFDNLDVQEEVDNKLDEMVESGELQEIISAYLDSKAVLGFNTIADLQSATNLVDGSITRTLGQEEILDGKGAFYRIRGVLTTDVIDGVNKVSLTNYPELIAEIIPNYFLATEITNRENADTNLQNQINATNNRLNDDIVVLLGDSYGVNNTSHTYAWYSWGDKLAELRGWTEGVDYFNFCTGNSGLTVVDNNYYANLLANESRITDKTKVKTFIIAGGYNDNYYFSGSNNDSDYATKLEELVTYIQTNYVNAEIYMGMIGNSKALNGTGIRSVMINNALYGYSKIENYPRCHYMKNVECVMHRYDYFYNDNTHPNEAGATMLAQAINESVYGSGYTPIFNKAQITFSSVTINVNQIGNNLAFSLTGSCYPTISVTSMQQVNFTTSYTIADTQTYIRNVSSAFTNIPFIANAACSDGTNTIIRGNIKLTSDDGTIIFAFEPTSALVNKSVGRLDFKYETSLIPIIYF